MSKKHARNKQQVIPDSSRVLRLLEKGDAKEAVKEAKRCLRIDNGSDNRRLLEEALLGRVEQLHRLKQNAEAKTVLSELDRLKPSAPQFTERLTRLRVLLGDDSANAHAALLADPQLLTEMIDKAVLDERCVIPEGASIKSQVIAVREALVAVERGEDNAAAELLADVSRTSPLADWRLFVRGLSAFYQRHDERTCKNWDRLDATRPAFILAATLRSAAEPDPAAKAKAVAQSPGLADRLKRLERQQQSEGAVALLKEMAAAWRREKWPTVIARLTSLHRRFGNSDPALIRLAVDITWKQAVREHVPRLLHQLKSGVPEPDLDPNWNRATALLYEHPDSPTIPEDDEAAWLDYLDDLKELTVLTDQERQIAVGLVFQRLARMFRQASEHAMEPPSFPFFGHYDEEDRALEQKEFADAAARYYRESFEACPKLKDSWLELVSLHEELDQPKEAATVMKKFAETEPDNFEAAIWLASHFLSEDKPAESEKYIATARRLRPRDRSCEVLSWNQKITSVRCFTIKRKFDAAREALESAAQEAPADVGPLTLELLRAGIEFKAKNVDEANRFVDAALAKVSDPLPVWMLMGVNAGRMRVAREFKKTFDDRFKNDIRNEPTSEAAGMMSEMMAGLKRSQANYTGRATHERLLLSYLQSSLDIDWQEVHLRQVCDFLELLPRHSWLRERLVQRGVKQFPKAAHFHFWYAMEEVDHGPFYCDHEAVIRAFETALELHGSGESRLGESEVESARGSLSMVKEYHERRSATRFGGRFFDDDDEEEPIHSFGMPNVPDIDEKILQRLLDTMPPDLQKSFEKLGEMSGASVEDLTRIAMGMAAEGRLPL